MIIFKPYLILLNPVFPKLIPREPFSYNQLTALQNTLQQSRHKYKQ